MNNQTVEIDLGYLVTLFNNTSQVTTDLSSNWLFWVVTYLVVAYVYGLRLVRKEVATALTKRKNGDERSSDTPPEVFGPLGFLLSPAWFPLHLLWLGVSYKTVPQDTEDVEEEE